MLLLIVGGSLVKFGVMAVVGSGMFGGVVADSIVLVEIYALVGIELGMGDSKRRV